tara:strand:- start:1482 stop:2396 length:915 start_codon:yes stop_codon:yes gene_type:complete
MFIKFTRNKSSFLNFRQSNHNHKNIDKFKEKIIVLGDIGYFNNTLRQIVNICKLNFTNNDKMILLGDNFYPDGVNDINDNLWYSYNDIFKNIPKNLIYSILGNHDYHQNPLCQLNNNYWSTPSPYYKLNFNNNTDLFFIDTVQLYPGHCYISKNIIENVHNKPISQLINKQIEWLDNELSKSNNKNKIVFGHYPIISNGAYKDEMRPLYKLLYPIFKKHNVKAYVSGHDHNIQYLKRKDDNYILNQFIIGSTAENRINRNMFFCLVDMYNDKDNFFLQIGQDNKSNYIFNFINKNNTIKYSYTI